MNIKLILSSLRTLVRNRQKTFFMSIGVIVGVATLIAGQSLGAGAGKQVSERMEKMFGKGSILLFSSRLKQADLEVIKGRMDQVVGIAPRFSAGELEVSFKGINRTAAVYGHTEQGETVWARGVIDGRFFTTSDINRSARIALIGTRLATLMFVQSDPIGKEILIDAVPFEIIGLLENMGIDPHGEDRDEDVFVPISTAMRRLNNVDVVGSAKLVVSNHERVTEDAQQISEILRERYQISDDERDDFFIYTSKFASEAIADATDVLTTYLYVAVGVVLLVAAVVISSIMQVVVRDRIPEIGLRIAVGATVGNIRFQFFTEVIAVTLVSGLAGIVVGLLAAKGISVYIDVPLVISNQNIAMGLLSALIVGIGAGVLPAHTAAKLNPVESLQ